MGRRVLELGAQLVICGRRQNVLEETRAEFDADFPGRSRAISCDLRDAAEVDRLVTAVWEEGPLDFLVNHAAGNFLARSETPSTRGRRSAPPCHARTRLRHPRHPRAERNTRM